MYQGYRLKINGVVFPNSYIQKGTYSCLRKKRVIDNWTDGNLIEYELTAPTRKAVISFQLREHNSSEHSLMMPFFQEDDYISIEYYSDREDAYFTGTFRMSDMVFSDRTANDSSIEYNRTLVTFTEH